MISASVSSHNACWSQRAALASMEGGFGWRVIRAHCNTEGGTQHLGRVRLISVPQQGAGRRHALEVNLQVVYWRRPGLLWAHCSTSAQEVMPGRKLCHRSLVRHTHATVVIPKNIAWIQRICKTKPAFPKSARGG